MIKELVRSEGRSLDSCKKTIQWLLDLYDPASRIFHVSVSSMHPIPKTAALNTATSHIGVVLDDISTAALTTTANLARDLCPVVPELRASYLTKSPSDILPLGSFGVLPVFSTCFLQEFMSGDARSLDSAAFAISTRRVLYLIYTNFLKEDVTSDLLHPYVVYRLARSATALLRLLATEGTDAAANFLKRMQEEYSLTQGLPGDRSLGYHLGFKEHDPVFSEKWLPEFKVETLDALLQLIERHALNSASTELAWHSTRKDRADPTALLFAAATLSFLSPGRHEILVAEALKVLLSLFGGGSLPARRPFYMDDRGRALFVATLECASIFLELALARFSRMGDSEISELLRVTDDLELHLIEDVNALICDTSEGRKLRCGWSSDRAYSRARIDSWVTVEAYAFFRRRVELIRLAKKRLVLSQYSWVPPERCVPAWEQMVDTNMGDPSQPSVLDSIASIVAPGSRKPGSFLLYGPPGTAKTSIAYGLAEKRGWELITLSPSDFVVDSLDQIERRSRELFSHMMNVEPCIILFDEMDTLLRDRETLGQSSAGMMIEFVVPALLPKLQQLRDHMVGREVAAFFVTNFYERLDSAVVRGGRLDHHLLILPYTRAAQRETAKRILEKRVKTNPMAPQCMKDVAKLLDRFACNLTYRDVDGICDAVLQGPDGINAIEDSPGGLGISPAVYSPGKRPRSFRELLAFMQRYGDEPVGSELLSISPADARKKFDQLSVKYVEYKEFFQEWADTVSRDATKARKAERAPT